MCVTCGCREYEDDHGDKRNITMTALRQAGEAAGIGLPEVGRNIEEAIGSGTGPGRQPAADPMSRGNSPQS
jgi:hypothetical protein